MDMLRFGTRGSRLALWQTTHVMGLLGTLKPELAVEYAIISTRGDQILDTPLPLIGGKGVFTAELEAALHAKRIDCAVHSLKDLPTEQPSGLAIGAIPERANPADVLISRHGLTLDQLPHGAVIGTSSHRRAAQIRHHRPDLMMRDIRGNVDTRIRKALDPNGGYDAIVLAHAGLARLGYLDVVTQILDLELMMPAPSQGAIAVQTRDDQAIVELLGAIHHAETALAVTAERAFLAGLGGGCSLPIGAYARWNAAMLELRGRVAAPDGSRQIDVQISASVSDANHAHELGVQLAHDAIMRGAHALIGHRQ